MNLNDEPKKIAASRYQSARKASTIVIPTSAGRASKVSLSKKGKLFVKPSDPPKPRLTSREILQIKEFLKKEQQAEISVPSVAHLAGKYDSETMNEIRQAIRENREEEALLIGDE